MRLGCSANKRAWIALIGAPPEGGAFTPAPAG
jgi:hypothetical protein